MAKFIIALCVIISAFGVQAGFISTGVSLMKSNIIAIINQLSAYQTKLENAAGISVQDLITYVAKLSGEYEEQMAATMSANSGSSACSVYLTQLRTAKNDTVDTMNTYVKSVIANAQTDTLVAMELGDVMLAAAESAETKIIECFSNIFTIASCFQEVKGTVIASVASNITTLITAGTELVATQAVMAADIASFQLSMMNNFNSVANDLNEVMQECAVSS